VRSTLIAPRDKLATAMNVKPPAEMTKIAWPTRDVYEDLADQFVALTASVALD
jgi:hypothetical protein